MAGCTLSDNFAVETSGAIFNEGGTLTVTASTLSSNSAGSAGGAIYNKGGTLTVTASTLSSNSAGSAGGAIDNKGGTLTVTASTLSSNSAGSAGGAIGNESGTLSVVNSTLFGNLAFPPNNYGRGGAIWSLGTLTLSSSTLADNRSDTGSTLYIEEGSVTVRNNLVFTTDFDHAFYGFTNPDHSGDANKNFCFERPDIAGLGELADNGGPTQTMALLPGSPLINKGDATGAPQFDQRGEPRVQRGALDVGAYESAFSLEPTDITLSNATIANASTSGVTVGTLSTTDPESNDSFTYSLVSGTGASDNAAFTVEGNALKMARPVNYATQSFYSIRVRTRDHLGLTFEKAFIISVSNVNDAPTDVFLSNDVIDENSAIGTTIGTLLTTDANVGNTFTYTLVSGSGDSDNVAFTIDGNSLKTAVSIDFETKTTYSIRVQTRDNGGLTFQKAIIIRVRNVYDEIPSLVVTTLSDVVAEDGVTSLREAINVANSDGVNSAITFSVSGTIVPERIFPALANNGTLSITGPVAGMVINGSVRRGDSLIGVPLFAVNGGANVTLENLELREGAGFVSYGGAISNLGTLSVNKCRLNGNKSPVGGAIYNEGTLTVTGSNFNNNKSIGGAYGIDSDTGGAIYNQGTATLRNSTFYRNESLRGGALRNGNIMTVTNCTFLSNTSYEICSAIYNDRSLTLINNTFAFNVDGGSVDTIFGGDTSAKNNIFAQNNAPFSTFPDPTSAGDADKNYSFSYIADAGLILPIDLNNVTGPMALSPNSRMIDAGLDTTQDPDNLTTDGRGPGFPRKVGSGVDVGAFEYQSPPTVSIANVSLLEGSGGTPQQMRFTVSVSSVSSSAVTVNYATAAGTATTGSDFTSTMGTFTIPAGQSSGTISVPIIGDTTKEPDETFSLNLTVPTGATFAGGATTLTATGTILNDDATPTISLSGVSQAEGNSGSTPFNFTVRLSVPSSVNVSLNYATSDGSATAGSDYTATSGTLTIPANSTSGTIAVPVTGDIIAESDETFSLTLSSPSNAVFPNGATTLAATGTIVNDDNNTTPAASNVTSQFTIYRSSLTRNRSTGRWVLAMVIQNSGATLDGPLYLAFDNLSSGVSLYNPDGSTSRTTPAGSSYRTLPLPGVSGAKPSGTFASGSALNLNVEFVNPINATIDFTPRLLQGPGTP